MHPTTKPVIIQAMKSYDIIIVGAGLVGTSLALALKPLGLNLLILENHILDTSKAPNKHSRPISLAASSVASLKKLNVWTTLADDATAIKHVHASEQGRFGRLKISAQDHNLAALGYVVPFDCLRHTLYLAAANTGAEIASISDITSIDQDNDNVTVTIDQAGQQQQLRCTWLIGADGTHSRTRQLLNIDVKETDHQEMALTATLSLSRQLDTGFERFTKNGIVAVLPRANKQAGLVWTINQDQAAEVNNWSEQELATFVSQTFKERIGTIQALKRGAYYPLISRTAKQQYQGRCLLLGNSAHSFYPIAAQGFNLSLRDTLGLAECVRFACEQEVLNDQRLFPTYLAERQPDQERIQKLVGSISLLFDLDIPGLSHMRSLGLLALDIFKPLKHRIAERALGLSGQAKRIGKWHEQ